MSGVRTTIAGARRVAAFPACGRPGRGLAGIAVLLGLPGLLVAVPAPLHAQSALERPPTLTGAWVGTPGAGYFHFIHRFSLIGDVNKVVNVPSFLLAAGLPARTLAGLVYSSSSDVSDAVEPNEWEAFVRLQPIAERSASRAGMTLQAGYNTAAGSVDGEAAVRGTLRRITAFGSVRAFSSGYGGDGRVALGGGALVRLGRWAALGGDVASLLDRSPDESIGWSAGVLLGIPHTPHTLSLHATNVGSNTLQGSSRGSAETRWGFEFTVPLTPARYTDRTPRVADLAIPPRQERASVGGGDTLDVGIGAVEFAPARIEVTPGTTVRWTNRAPLAHTVTADDESWGSPLLEEGERWSRTFSEPGTYPFHCAPHPFMKGVVVVREETASPDP